MRFAQEIMRAPGIGIELSPERVAAARKAGFAVEQGDVLAYEGRSIASAAIAVDLMPELDGRRAFDQVLIAMLRAARDFIVVQHQCFDSAESLLARGLTVPGHADRSVRLRVRAADYLHFLQQYGGKLDLVGLAAFGLGEPKTEPLALGAVSGALLPRHYEDPVYRSLRVIVARKDPGRFRAALDRAGSGDCLLFWER